MALIWTNDWNIGIDIIDEQHKRIVDYINALENANMSTTGKVLLTVPQEKEETP